MDGGMGGTTTTVRFLQEENQRLSELNEQLREENSYLHDCLKAIRGLQKAVSSLDPGVGLQRLLSRIVYEAVRTVDGVDGSLSLIDEATQELVFVVVRGAIASRYLPGGLPNAPVLTIQNILSIWQRQRPLKAIIPSSLFAPMQEIRNFHLEALTTC